MGNKIGQMEIPSTKATKKEIKKERTRKLRKWNKNKDFVPQYNRYTGYS